MTIASSTTKPVAMVSAISDRLSSPKPSRLMIAKVPISDSGSATAGMKVARSERRNTKITSTTSTTDMISVICTSSTEARIVSVRSMTMVSLIPDGMAACRRGSSAFTRSTVCTMLAPGWRWMSSTAAGSGALSVPRYQAPTRSFSTPRITLPMSDSRTGAPLRHASTRF